MDEEYVDNDKMARRAIEDIPAVDPRKPRFLKLDMNFIPLNHTFLDISGIFNKFFQDFPLTWFIFCNIYFNISSSGVYTKMIWVDFIIICSVRVSLEVSFQLKILVKFFFCTRYQLLSVKKSTFTISIIIGQKCSFGHPWCLGRQYNGQDHLENFRKKDNIPKCGIAGCTSKQNATSGPRRNPKQKLHLRKSSRQSQRCQAKQLCLRLLG